MKHLMIDLETLGTSGRSCILAIGAVRFDLDTLAVNEDEGFYTAVSIDSNLQAGRTIDESTLIWWMGQSDAARAVFKQPKMALSDALAEFEQWMGDIGPDTVVWGNGPSFDLGMLSDAYRSQGWEAPWKFFNERCVRTYRDLPIAKRVAKVQPAVAHNALHDALAQAQHIVAIHRALLGADVPKKVKT